ncbi:MAG: hypothetical protein C5B52_15300 [Bacteroidetes bacterium]|nr:MAG: hypothetical protein C5B52_15300 [Bacteroidota bacterium]
MAELTEKKIHELARLIAPKVKITDWEPYGAQVKVKDTDVELIGSPISKWFAVLKTVDKKDRLSDFLTAIIKDYDDEQLKTELEELKKGYSVQLENIVKAIKTGECILFLGPGVLAITEDNVTKTFNERLAEQVGMLLDEKNKYYDQTQSENISYMVQRYKKTVTNNSAEIADEAIKLYEDFTRRFKIDTAVMDQLAKIPWKLVINTNPDSILATTMNKAKKDSCLIASYTLENNAGLEFENPAPGDSQCLLYNLFGTFEKPSSILYTDSDFLRFNTKVTGDYPPLNEYVIKMFDSQKKYLFLGFDFDQWYFKILFNKILELNVDQQNLVSLHCGAMKFNEMNVDYFEEEYKLYFVNENLVTFVKILLDAYEKLA